MCRIWLLEGRGGIPQPSLFYIGGSRYELKIYNQTKEQEAEVRKQNSMLVSLLG